MMRIKWDNKWESAPKIIKSYGNRRYFQYYFPTWCKGWDLVSVLPLISCDSPGRSPLLSPPWFPHHWDAQRVWLKCFVENVHFYLVLMSLLNNNNYCHHFIPLSSSLFLSGSSLDIFVAMAYTWLPKPRSPFHFEIGPRYCSSPERGPSPRLPIGHLLTSVTALKTMCSNCLSVSLSVYLFARLWATC